MSLPTNEKCFSPEFRVIGNSIPAEIVSTFGQPNIDERKRQRRAEHTADVNLKRSQFLEMLRKTCYSVNTIRPDAAMNLITDLFRIFANYRSFSCDFLAQTFSEGFRKMNKNNFIHVLKMTEECSVFTTISDDGVMNDFTTSLRILCFNMIMAGLARRELHNLANTLSLCDDKLRGHLIMECAALHESNQHSSICVVEKYDESNVCEHGCDVVMRYMKMEAIRLLMIEKCGCYNGAVICNACHDMLSDSTIFNHIHYKFEDERNIQLLQSRNKIMDRICKRPKITVRASSARDTNLKKLKLLRSTMLVNSSTTSSSSSASYKFPRRSTTTKNVTEPIGSLDARINDLRGKKVAKPKKSIIKHSLAHSIARMLAVAVRKVDCIVDNEMGRNMSILVDEVCTYAAECTQCLCPQCERQLETEANERSTNVDRTTTTLYALLLYNEICNSEFLFNLCGESMYMRLQTHNRKAPRMYFNIIDNKYTENKEQRVVNIQGLENLSKLLVYNTQLQFAVPVTLCAALCEYIDTSMSCAYNIDMGNHVQRDNIRWLVKNKTGSLRVTPLYTRPNTFSLYYRLYSVKNRRTTSALGSLLSQVQATTSKYHRKQLWMQHTVSNKTLNVYNRRILRNENSTTLKTHVGATVEKNKQLMKNFAPNGQTISLVPLRYLNNSTATIDSGLSSETSSEEDAPVSINYRPIDTTNAIHSKLNDIFGETLLSHILELYASIVSSRLDCTRTYQLVYEQFNTIRESSKIRRYETDMFFLVADEKLPSHVGKLMNDQVLLKNKSVIGNNVVFRVIERYAKSTIEALSTCSFDNTVILLNRPPRCTSYFICQFENNTNIVIDSIVEKLLRKVSWQQEIPGASSSLSITSYENPMFSNNEVNAIQKVLLKSSCQSVDIAATTEEGQSVLIMKMDTIGIGMMEKMAETLMRVHKVYIGVASDALAELFRSAKYASPVSDMTATGFEVRYIHSENSDPSLTKDEINSLDLQNNKGVVKFIGQLSVAAHCKRLDPRIFSAMRKRVSILRFPNADFSFSGLLVTKIAYSCSAIREFRFNYFEIDYFTKSLVVPILYRHLESKYEAIRSALFGNDVNYEKSAVPMWDHRGPIGTNDCDGLISVSANVLLLSVYTSMFILVNTYDARYFKPKRSYLRYQSDGSTDIDIKRLNNALRPLVLGRNFGSNLRQLYYDFPLLISLVLVNEYSDILYEPTENNGHRQRTLHVLYLFYRLIDHFATCYLKSHTQPDLNGYISDAITRANSYLNYFETTTFLRVPLRPTLKFPLNNT